MTSLTKESERDRVGGIHDCCAETSTIYYKGNHFEFTILLSNLRGLCAKLLRLAKRCGPRPVRSLSMRLWTPRWRHMRAGQDLAMLAYNGIQLHPIIRPSDPSPQGIFSAYDGMCGAALESAVRIGKKAADEGWEEKRVRARLNQWLVLCLSSKAAGKRSRWWKLAIEI
ncbi:hypothetical protein LTR35_002945 [Friedmanniomyces endolithicus]|uniref:Uncharacterized protein n=1 Tax=Friedmanniomyces endolithicus TaxID=329885 RepID=A0AAN6G414_9PEZI|nr:hypothetical protein LTS00_012408 [Friedmanniomyces endolithicus]KAK0289747.1 hypothetical protein LTR35_002945 [Friedmanniomyces endolithicus]KAK0328477.1 hypothetical protein LTR82_000408 [Friedmanniomyces endolithicus]KAK1019826.1 hypothetical protein LTR54_000469 [Friedmanniomyces endolithicus]